MVTAERVREVLDYDPETGAFRWRVRRGRAMARSIAGTIGKKGYRAISIDCVIYRASRLAFLYMTGSWPEGQADHENKNRSDDRWENLRPASQDQNSRNRGIPKNNTSGFKGVERRGNRFRAYIGFGGKRKNYLGTFGSAAEAARAYDAAARKHHGNFASTNFEVRA